jgi:cobaltochelatase CobN
VRLASEADDPEDTVNHVREGTLTAERVMKERGLSPLDARTFATARVFGGVNGSYSTRIMGMVEAGDRWTDDKEVTNQYLKNMGAIYTESHWGYYAPGIFEAALQHADTLIHSRSSNVWTPLSLDHVYEFMGGMSAVIRNVTGADPEALFSDLRNRHNPAVQEAKQAIWTDTRTTLMNPKYIRDLQAGGTSSADQFAETFRNTYGWNVMRPAAIDTELWEGLYNVYIKDTHHLDMEAYFREKNPFALQEMTAVMLETIRKGYWDAGQDVIKTLADLHARLIQDYQAGCSGFVCDNAKLRVFVAGNLAPELAQTYSDQIDQVLVGTARASVSGIRLEKTLTVDKLKEVMSRSLPTLLTLSAVVVLFAGAVILGARRRRV